MTVEKKDQDIEALLDDSDKKHCQCVRKMSNLSVLAITAFLFAAFVVAEIIGALAGNSLSLLGDAAAMSVDVFTYFTNMYAEYLKSTGHRAMDKRTRFMLEVYIPTFSVCALLGVTGWVTSDAIGVIMDGGGDDDVSVIFMFAFAAGNFVVDALSTGMFYLRGEDILEDRRTFSVSRDFGTGEHVNPLAKPPKSNLNMMSALTHVGGDTMRTTAVFLAALIATVTPVKGSLCDAWAAIIVSITICFAVVPLVKEIYKSATTDP